MDWHKAKTILIIALLITNLALGGLYLSKTAAENKAEERSARLQEEYLSSRGVILDCKIPSETASLPVLFVSLQRSQSPQQTEYDGLKVEISSSRSYRIQPVREGDTKGRTISASAALQKLIAQEELELEGLRISNIELVYWLSADGASAQTAEDTAVPAWKISTDRGDFYIEAFDN